MNFEEFIEAMMLITIVILGILTFVQIISSVGFIVGSIVTLLIGIGAWKLGEV